MNNVGIFESGFEGQISDVPPQFDLHKMAAKPFSTCGFWQQLEEDQRSHGKKEVWVEVEKRQRRH